MRMYFEEIKIQSVEFVEEAWQKIAFGPHASKNTPTLQEFKEKIKRDSQKEVRNRAKSNLVEYGEIGGNIGK